VKHSETILFFKADLCRMGVRQSCLKSGALTGCEAQRNQKQTIFLLKPFKIFVTFGKSAG